MTNIKDKVKNISYYEDLQAIGTLNWHKVTLGQLYATDGAVTMFKALQCFWVSDVMVSYLPDLLKRSEFMFFVRVLLREDGGADFYITDGDYNVIVHQDIESTDLKENVLLYMSNQGDGKFVTCLPSED